MDYRQQIEDLSISELTGMISPQESEILHRALATNALAREIYAEVKAVFDTEQGQRVLNRPISSPDELLARISSSRRRVIRLALAGGIAASLLVCAAVIHQLNLSTKSAGLTSVSQSTGAVAKKHITLTLAGGQSVDLSDTLGQQTVANVSMNNSGGKLSFNKVPDAVQWALLTVPAGKDYKVDLSDGSQVWLNSQTTIHFPLKFSGDLREIDIEGEAYIKVNANAVAPFTVHVGGTRVQVLGTEFNVNTYDSGQVRVALVSGAVNFAVAEQTVSVKPGFQLSYKSGQQIHQEKFDPRVVLGWREGIFIYRDASLQDLGRILGRWFGVDVVVDNPGVNQMRFDGVVRRDDEIEEYLKNLEYTNGPSYYIKDKVVHFK